jgi:hypothetical protein
MRMLKNLLCACPLALLAVAPAVVAGAGDALLEGSQVEAVRKMNDNYFRSWREGDMDWYRQNLAEHFVLIAGDGSVQGKQAFISPSGQQENIRDAHIEDVVVRVYPSGTAVVTGNTVVNWKSGKVTATRYTDVYALIAGQWQAVSAQLTPDRNFRAGTVGD